MESNNSNTNENDNKNNSKEDKNNKPKNIGGDVDDYGCNNAAGYYWYGSQGSCCKCTNCGPPKPWVCSPDDLSPISTSDWHGCKVPQEKYFYQANICCSCDCVAPKPTTPDLSK